MKKSSARSLGGLGLLLGVGILLATAVISLRLRSRPERRVEKPVARPSSAVGPIQTLPESPKRGSGPPVLPVRKPNRARAAFDRVVAALRGGDREKIKEALEDLRAEIVPPPVPDAENAAVLYMKAFKLYPKGMDERETDLVIRLGEGQPLAPDDRASLQAVLDRNREALNLLHEAAERPRCNFNLDYSQGVSIELPHIDGMIRAARLLNLEALLNEGAPIAEASRASFRLAEAVADEPVLVSQLVRDVCHGIGAEAREREFEGDNSLDRLQALVETLDPERARGGYEKTLFFELYSLTRCVLDGVELPDFTGRSGRSQPLRLENPLTANDLAYYAETISEVAALVDRPYYEVRDELARIQVERVQAAPAYADLTKLAMPSIVKVCERQAEAEATLGTGQVAAGLRLYREARGAYPASLEELRAILPSLPVDPFTGKPFLYRREGSGFVVYSAGADGVDGGGVSAGRDILFKSPR